MDRCNGGRNITDNGEKGIKKDTISNQSCGAGVGGVKSPDCDVKGYIQIKLIKIVFGRLETMV